MSKKVVLAGACRTAIGTMGGSLSGIPAAEHGADLSIVKDVWFLCLYGRYGQQGDKYAIEESSHPE